MKKQKNIIPLLLSIIILISTFFMGIGYATINSVILDVSGNTSAVPQSGVFISDVTCISNNGESYEIKGYYRTILNSQVVLSQVSSSSITYKISIYNNSNENQTFKEVKYDQDFYDNPNIKFELNGLNQNDVIRKRRKQKFYNNFFI